MRFTFKKTEKLTSKKVMDEVFANGNTIKAFPFIVKYSLVEEQESPVQLAISVPKRNFKKAVDRNKIKRLIREAYRLNKGTLVESMKMKNKNLAFFLIYSGKEKLTFSRTEEKIKLLLKELKEKA